MVIIKSILRIITLALAVVLTVTLFHSKAEEYKQESISISPITASMRERQLKCLADNIYFEAGYESFEGKVAVAQVTLNRASNGKWPSDVCGVVYQKNVVYEKVICQFSWYCQQGPKYRISNKQVYNESMTVAKKVLLEGFRLPSMSKALYYHADYVDPKWKKPKLTKIGRHIFYSEI
jgi:spore germination cell wall hydrolase CwlJ-like protein